MSDERFSRAVRAFDALNSADPTLDASGRPRELAKADWLSGWISRLEPEASVALRLAARCQHLMRWTVKRSEFPDGPAGYHAWRRHMAEFHAQEAEKVLREAGYQDDMVTSVRRIVLKQGMKQHADVQCMEDALCLSFLEHDLGGFARGQNEEKLLRILRETWRKMSPRAHALAAELLPSLPEELRALVARALG